MLLRGKGHGGLIVHASPQLDYPVIDTSTAIGADCLWLADGDFPKDSNQVAVTGTHTGTAFVAPASFASTVDLSPCSSANGLTFEWEGDISNRNSSTYGYPIDARAADGTELATIRLRNSDTSMDIFAPDLTWGWATDNLQDTFIQDGSSHHYVITVAASDAAANDIKIYRDGVLAGHKTHCVATFDYTQPATIIWLPQSFDSNIRRAALYGRTLTASEAAQLYNTPRSILSN